MTHVIAFQILNKTHMCYYTAMNKLQKPLCQILGFMITYTITKCDTIDYTAL
jgi:hypothetical protein